jgi:hypothetical protein
VPLPNAARLERFAAYGLYIVDGALQVAHTLLRGLAQTLDEQSQVDAVGARRLDATARRRVEQSLFGALNGLHCIATFLFIVATKLKSLKPKNQHLFIFAGRSCARTRGNN